MKADNSLELLPVVDEEGRQITVATRGKCHGGSMLLHPVVHLHLFNYRGELYMQRRPKWKDIQPGRWDTAVGGHIDPGETPAQALRREALEELGLDLDSLAEAPTLLARYVYNGERERELVYVYLLQTDAVPRPSDELDGGRFWTTAEIARASACGDMLTPNFTEEFIGVLLPALEAM